MNSKAWLIVCCFIVWSVGSGWFYTCKIKQVCLDSAGTRADSLAVGFMINDSEPIYSNLTARLLDSVRAKSNDENILEVTGLYTKEEGNLFGEYLGLQRAEKFLSVYGDSFKSIDFRIAADEIVLDSNVDYFSGLRFRWFTKNEKVEEAENTAILYLDQQDIIQLDVKIKAYLTYLSIERKDEVIDLVGHCYNQDSTGANYSCGLVYANFVRDKLVSNGFNEYQVNASSKGDSSLLNGQDSIARVEVQINE